MSGNAELDRLRALPLGERIRFLRTRRQNERGRPLSLDGYAELLGTTRQRVIAWESGSGISDEYAERLAELEGLPVDLFLPPERALTRHAQDAIADLATAAQELAAAAAELRPLLQRQSDVVDQMRALVAELSRRESAT